MEVTHVNVELNNVGLIQFEYEMQVYPQWNPDFHLGSYKGHQYHFEGFIHSFYYTIETYGALCNFLQDTLCGVGCNICPDYDSLYDTSDDGVAGFCLPECDYNQYLGEDINGDQICVNCHPGCKYGCTAADADVGFDTCFDNNKCHATCRTCTGPEAEDCTDCWCGAHRTNA